MSAVGRYKFNKMSIGARLANQKLALPVVDPTTGEIIAEPGEVLTRERAHELEDKGVNEAVVDVDGVQVRVFGNHMVDMSKFVDLTLRSAASPRRCATPCSWSSWSSSPARS